MLQKHFKPRFLSIFLKDSVFSCNRLRQVRTGEKGDIAGCKQLFVTKKLKGH